MREIGAAAAAYSPLPSFFFPAFGWHGRSGSLPEDNTQVGELARFYSIMNERNHEQTKSLVVGMDRKPTAKPAETAPRPPPATPAMTRTQTVDVRASKARALAHKETLPGGNNDAKSAVVRSTSTEGSAARRRSTAAAAAEAAAAQQRRAEALAACGARPSRTGPTREPEPRSAVSEELSAKFRGARDQRAVAGSAIPKPRASTSRDDRGARRCGALAAPRGFGVGDGASG